MRKTFFTVAAAMMMATYVIAQDIPTDMRMEIIESEDDSHDQYTIFKYKEKNGYTGYWMGVGNKTELLGLVRDDITDMSISHMDEVCRAIGFVTDHGVIGQRHSATLTIEDQHPGRI